MEKDEEQYMRRAIELAKKGIGAVNPNPLVGAVLVKDGRIIGEGYHRKYGELHAERNAIADCYERGENPHNAQLYVTLEPCCHYGKTPPCTDIILESGIRKVYVGSDDPNPLVNGGGVTVLREHGIEVITGVLREECDALNEIFFHYIQTKRPFVLMKYAMTLDGKIATQTGDSKWITNETARERVQEERNRYAAIMVGVQTIIMDNPRLNCRLPQGHSPIRVVCDTQLRTPLDATVVTTAQEVPTLIATCCTDTQKQESYRRYGCELLVLPSKQQDNGTEQVDIEMLMQKLGERKIDSVLLEGGATLNWSALQAGIVSKIHTYIAPKILGGITAKSPIGGNGVLLAADAYPFQITKIEQLGSDLLVESVPTLERKDKRCLRES